MPINIKHLRDDPGSFRESESRRGKDPAIVDDVLHYDLLWRQDLSKLENLRFQLAQLQAQIAQKKKESKGNDSYELELAKKKQLEQTRTELEVSVADFASKRLLSLSRIGNLLHNNVPTALTEAENQLLKCWGECRRTETIPHWQALGRLGACEFERGVRVAGRRGYFLRGDGVLLNMALQNYGVSFLVERGYVPLQPPYFMRKDVMARTAELVDFDTQLYKVSSSSAAESQPVQDATSEKVKSPNEASYLIATSEQPISALHQDESLKVSDLPLKYAGISPCFRTETSSRGLDAKGLFRVHQFEKIEQFCVCSPDDSWKLFTEMVSIVEEFYQSLGLPYRIVSVASGGLNNAAAMKYDLEAWFASSGEYRELVSCTNCTDFQARSLGVRLDEGQGSRHVHMLNSTLCATERTLGCIVEHYQEENGIRVPRVLTPYMGGRGFLRFPTDPVAKRSG